jgi:hypothetical protein
MAIKIRNIAALASFIKYLPQDLGQNRAGISTQNAQSNKRMAVRPSSLSDLTARHEENLAKSGFSA